MGKRYYLYAAVIMVVFAAVIVVALLTGIRSKKIGRSGTVTDASILKIMIDDPSQAYLQWRQRGFRGRIVIAISATLDFVDIDEASLISSGDGLRVFNLVDAIEPELNSRNFLYVAVRRGIAREVVHVVPRSVFSEKAEAARTVPGVTIASGKVLAPFYGSRRSIMPASLLTAVKEPALLYVNVSYFREEDPVMLMRRLVDSGIRTDAIVLCRTGGNGRGSTLERDRFDAFAAMLNGEYR